MSLFEQNNNIKSAEVKPYDFFTGEDKDFLQEMSIPKQSTGATTVVEDDFILEEIPFSENHENENSPNLTAKAAKSTAKLLGTAIDAPMSSLLAFVAKEKDASQFACTPDEKDTLTDALAEYLKVKGMDVPPGMMLFIVILTIYGGKAVDAFKTRAANVRAEKAEALLVDKTREFEALNEELEAYKNGRK